MPFADLREWISTLEAAGDLHTIGAEVDWDEEIGAITREVISREGPALLFTNIKGHQSTPCRRLFTNGTGSRQRVCRILGLPTETHYRDITREFKRRYAKTIPARRVDTGPVKKNRITGDEINLFSLPVPKWNPLDGGRYINTCASIVTMDPDTGELNAGTYRGMISKKNTISVLLGMTQDWGRHLSKYIRKKQDMPVAVVIGWDQSLFIAASTPVTAPEYDVAGSLRGAPVELVKCETSDLLVPASAEIVLEGTLSADPKTFELEGPYSEYPGYYGGKKAPKHVIKVNCITHRDDPIFNGVLTGATPGRLNEGIFWTPASLSAVAWQGLEDCGVPNIRGIWRKYWPEVLRIQIKKIYRGHAKQVANALWGSHVGLHLGKLLIVVDDDIDIFDDTAIEWALAYRVNAEMGDISFWPGTAGSMLDPSIPLEERNAVKYGNGKWTRVLIDATINWELEPQEQYGGNRYPPVGTDISDAMKEKLRKRWAEYGLASLRISPP